MNAGTLRSIERICSIFLMTFFMVMMVGSVVMPAARAATASVTIVDFAFNPSSLTINLGDTVTWTNTGTYAHTVTSDTGAFASGQLANGGTFSYTFNTYGTGSYAYHCSNHPYMTATINITPAIPEFPLGNLPMMIFIVMALVVLIGKRSKKRHE